MLAKVNNRNEALQIKKGFGLWLKRKREQRGLRIRQLAKFSGVSSAYISLIENGRRGTPTPKVLQKLAKPLKVSLQEIYKAAGYYEEITAEEKHIQAAHKQVEILLSEEDLNVVERFLKIARDRLKKEKGY